MKYDIEKPLRLQIIKFSNSVQFNSYLFTCKLNSPKANYKVSTSKKKETTKHKQNTI
jgi:hypothetical protein